MSLAQRAEIYEALKRAIDAGVACGSATIVRGEGAGRKLALLPDGVQGSIGSDALDALVHAALVAAIEAERSVTNVIADPDTREVVGAQR